MLEKSGTGVLVASALEDLGVRSRDDQHPTLEALKAALDEASAAAVDAKVVAKAQKSYDEACELRKAERRAKMALKVEAFQV